MATLPGFEPELNGPRPFVLPLHHRVYLSSFMSCSGHAVFQTPGRNSNHLLSGVGRITPTLKHQRFYSGCAALPYGAKAYVLLRQSPLQCQFTVRIFPLRLVKLYTFQPDFLSIIWLYDILQPVYRRTGWWDTP